MTTTTRPLVLNVTEAGNLLGVSRSTAYELVRTGELDSIRLRRRVVVPVAAVAERLGVTVPEIWMALRCDVRVTGIVRDPLRTVRNHRARKTMS